MINYCYSQVPLKWIQNPPNYDLLLVCFVLTLNSFQQCKSSFICLKFSRVSMTSSPFSMLLSIKNHTYCDHNAFSKYFNQENSFFSTLYLQPPLMVASVLWQMTDMDTVIQQTWNWKYMFVQELRVKYNCT